MTKILDDLGFEIKEMKKIFNLKIPSWRPDISQEVDVVEELIRIKGYDQINMIEPQKVREKETLNKKQKLFHFLQRAVASKGYLEAITWSFTDSKFYFISFSYKFFCIFNFKFIIMSFCNRSHFDFF